MNNSINTEEEFSVTMMKRVRALETELITTIRQRLGLDIHKHQVDILHKTVLDACQKFNLEPEAYLSMLTSCANNSEILEQLVTKITIGETYFFRDQKQMNLLRNQILPTLIQTKREQKNLSLRIWSAGCASGEELYSIAIMLKQLLPDINQWTLHLLGTDINTHVLKKALDGIYSEWSMRGVDDTIKETWFTRTDANYRLSPDILPMGEFLYLNLNDSLYPSILNGTNAQDLIICRNVLIYFDKNNTNRVMKKLNQSLVEGGYLILGASDPVDLTGTDLIFHHQSGLLFERPRIKAFSLKQTTPKIHEKTSHKIQGLAQPIANLTPAIVKPAIPINTDVISKLLNESRWQDTLDAIEIYKNATQSAFLSVAEATALANLGELEKATELCEQSLKLDATNKDTHILFAMILIELNQLQKAENELKNALFLDRSYVIAHFQLGLLQLRMHQLDAGIKSLKNALTIAATQNTSDTVPGAIGLNYGRLTDILKHELELHVTSGSLNNANR